ncbi:MAG: hypothetical protein K0S45_2592 [Nitrospira sp.]|nr:hypothetical protein [Nitrospira sp.]
MVSSEVEKEFNWIATGALGSYELNAIRSYASCHHSRLADWNAGWRALSGSVL